MPSKAMHIPANRPPMAKKMLKMFGRYPKKQMMKKMFTTFCLLTLTLSVMSFSQFVNTYRVHYAQELLRRQPDMKMTFVAIDSGFSTETSFFRNFKTVTGMTPREWLQEQLKE